jgi:hypothetical protein
MHMPYQNPATFSVATPRTGIIPTWLMAGLMAVCLTLVMLAAKPAAAATTCTFASVGTNDFNTDANWSCGHTPTGADDAVIPVATSTVLSAGHVIINSLDVAGSMDLNSNDISISATTTIEATGSLLINFGIANFQGDLVNLGILDANGGLLFIGGAWTNVGSFNNGPNASVIFDGASPQTVPSGISVFVLGVDTGSNVTLGGDATTTFVTSINSGGTFNLGGFTLHNQGTWSDSGTLTGIGTVDFNGAGSQTVGAEPNFNNVTVNKPSGTVSQGGNVALSGSFNSVGTSTWSLVNNSLLVTSSSNIGTNTTVTSTSGVSTWLSDLNVNGSLGSVNGGFVTDGALTNFGTVNIGTGSSTAVGLFDNRGTFNGGTGTLHVNDDWLENGGTFNAQAGTFFVIGGNVQGIDGEIFNNFSVNKTGSTASLNSSSTILGNMTITGSGTFDAGTSPIHILGNWSDAPDNFTSAGLVSFEGTNAQTISDEANFFNLTINKATGTVSLVNEIETTNDFNILSGTFNLNGQAIDVGGDWNDTAAGLTGTGFVYFNGSSAQAINTEANFYDLFISNAAATTTLAGNVTTTHSFTVFNPGTRVDVNGFRLDSPGTIVNNGLITLNSGHLIHDATSYAFGNVSGAPVSFYTAGNTIYVTLVDADRNLNGSATETLPITVTTPGGDSETLTLTETAAGSGTFRNTTGPTLMASATHTSGNNLLESATSGLFSSTYTDAQDPADTMLATNSFRVSVVTSGGGGGGTGGGGLSAGTSLPINPTQQSYTNNLQNLQNQGIAIHSLVKLPCQTLSESLDPNAPCKAVYYVGMDGMRHAFPNSKVYFTWYSDFSGVQVVSAAQLASIPLGKNVTYKPGVKMVKFMTSNDTYVVVKGGVLRKIGSEAVAISLYGPNWNHMIDDISDAFFTNYTFGADVLGTSDYSPTAAMASVTYPSDSLQP